MSQLSEIHDESTPAARLTYRQTALQLRYDGQQHELNNGPASNFTAALSGVAAPLITGLLNDRSLV
jgi:hypothetical protein